MVENNVSRLPVAQQLREIGAEYLRKKGVAARTARPRRRQRKLATVLAPILEVDQSALEGFCDEALRELREDCLASDHPALALRWVYLHAWMDSPGSEPCEAALRFARAGFPTPEFIASHCAMLLSLADERRDGPELSA